jgi:hypothetical protein
MAALPDYTAWLARFFRALFDLLYLPFPQERGMNDLSELRECQ